MMRKLIKDFSTEHQWLLKFYRQARFLSYFTFKRASDHFHSQSPHRYEKENYVNQKPVEWWEDHLNHQLLREQGDLISGRLLDIGSGCGAISILSSRLTNHVTGVDLNIAALERGAFLCTAEADDVQARLSWVNALFTHLPFASGSFDGGYMIDVLEHIFASDRPHVMHEIQRVMREGAHLLIVTPNGRDYYDPSHVAFFTPKLLMPILQQLGFEVLYCELDQRRDVHQRHNRITALVRVVK